MTLSDLATEPEIQIAPETLQRLLFKPQDYVGVAEVALSEDHDYDIGHPHSACGRGYPPSRVGHVCFYRAILKIQVPDADTVVYRITAYDPENNTWIASWPD